LLIENKKGVIITAIKNFLHHHNWAKFSL